MECHTVSLWQALEQQTNFEESQICQEGCHEDEEHAIFEELTRMTDQVRK